MALEVKVAMECLDRDGETKPNEESHLFGWLSISQVIQLNRVY
jgi:hypothetical protein